MSANKKTDVALVLSSGGPRGFAYIGAIEELISRGYNITSVAGTSIGSLIGGIFAAGKLTEFKEWLFDLDNFKLMRLLDVSISASYLLRGQKVIERIKEVVPDMNIEDLPIPYVAVATDLYSGEPVVYRQGKLFNAIRSSISIPSLFMPNKDGWRVLVDGGIVSTFPLSYVVRNGNDILVGFDVNDTDAEAIESTQRAAFEQREETQKAQNDSVTFMKDVTGDKSLTFMEKARMIGDEGERLFRKTFLEEKIEDPIGADDNYFSILTRSFAIANHTIAKLETKLNKPDILVKMSFDSYGAIPDYAKGSEISDKGRALMAEALDKYEKGLS